MSDLRIYPVLPTEVLHEVFRYISYNDTRRVLNVNSYFRAVAQPYAYQYGTITKFGLHFPGATNPYPFFDNPDPRIVNLSDEERETVLRQLKRVDFANHTQQECCDGSIPGPDIPPLKVLHLEMHTCDLPFPEEVCSPRSGRRRSPEPRPRQERRCGFLGRWVPSCTREPVKLVARGLPVSSSSCYSPEEFTYRPEVHVSVLYSQPSWRAPGDGDCYTRPDLDQWELSILGSRRLVVIFWTRLPGETWIPPCRHYADHNHANMCHLDEKTVWHCLAVAALESCVEEVVVVNSSAIPPDAWRQAHHNLLPGELCQLQAQHAECFENEMVVNAKDNCHRSYFAHEFLSMEEWIRRGEWEDVFTHAEMEPWLRKMRDDEERGDTRSTRCV